MNTIFKMSQGVATRHGFFMAVRQFLDDFYRARQDEKAEMIKDPPADISAANFAVPYTAAAVHKLCVDFGLRPPDWVFEGRCYCPDADPYFMPHVTGESRWFYMYHSPSEFKHRNLFVPQNALSRA